MGNSRRQYSAEFKQEAVNMVTMQQCSVAEVAHRLGIHEQLLRRWKKKLEAGTGTTGPSQPTAVEQENRQLREEVRRLTMERDILKKATVFFAKESR